MSLYLGGVDVLLTPTVLGDAPLYSQFSQADNRARTQEQDVFTQPVNLAGLIFVYISWVIFFNEQDGGSFN